MWSVPREHVISSLNDELLAGMDCRRVSLYIMGKKVVYLLLTVVFFQYKMTAQQICPEGEEPASVCDNACLLCDIDGLSRSVNTNNSTGWGKSGCEVGVGDVYRFIAMSTTLTVEVTVGRCATSNNTPKKAGFVIYEDNGTCTDTLYGTQLTPFTECVGSASPGPQFIDPNSSKTFTTLRELIVGKLYYLEVGSSSDTDCQYSIKVLEGSTAVPQLTTFSLDGVYNPCLGEIVDYAVTNPEPITNYIYTLNGDTISREETATVSYDLPGTYEVCVTGSNPCSQAALTCYTITVDPHSKTMADATLCPGQCYTTPDTTLCDPGTYALRLTDQNGCDSLVNLTLTSREPDVTDLQATICNGDTLRYRGQQYFAAGTYPTVLTNQYGCDSTAILGIELAACPLEGALSTANVRCHDGTDGSIRFRITSGSPPYRYDFRRLGGGPSGSGSVALRDEETILAGLPAGTYLIEVSDDFGSVGYLNTEIERPPAVELSTTFQDYNGSDLSCTDSSDGQIVASATGGTGGFTFAWSAGTATGPQLSQLAAGTYSVTATDRNGCTAATTTVLVAPPPIGIAATAVAEDCEQTGTGKLMNRRASGGTEPLSFTLLTSGGNEVPQTAYETLAAGTYRLVVTDANGCRSDTVLSIASPVRADAAISPVDPVVTLGDALDLAVAEQPGATYAWSPVDSASGCADCPDITVVPVIPTTYRVTVTSEDGCTATDSVRVNVDRIRKVYVPNAFSPNNDGVNDVLLLYPGQAVRMIRQLSVFDRWGGLRYVTEDILPLAAGQDGWDGTFSDRQPAPPGVYLWVAEVEFIDGIVEVLQGTVALLR